MGDLGKDTGLGNSVPDNVENIPGKIEGPIQITIDGITKTFIDENEWNSRLKEKFAGFYNEELVVALEKQGRYDLVAKYIDSSRIESWLFDGDRFYFQRMRYFLDYFENFVKICGKHELSNGFALRLLNANTYDYDCGSIVLNYPESFNFYVEKPNEIDSITGLENSYENFKYRNYGKVEDMDIIKKLISSGYDLSKIEKLSNIVGNFLEGGSWYDVNDDSYIQFLDNLDREGYCYAKDNRDEYVQDYYDSFNAVEDVIIGRVLKDQNSYEDISKILDEFGKFNQEMLAVLVSLSKGWKYIRHAYDSNDENQIEKFKGLDFKKAVEHSLIYYYFDFKVDQNQKTMPWMEDEERDFAAKFFGLETSDENVKFINKNLIYSLRKEMSGTYEKLRDYYYRNGFDYNGYYWRLWVGFRDGLNKRINYFGLRGKSEVEVQKVAKYLLECEKTLEEKLIYLNTHVIKKN